MTYWVKRIILKGGEIVTERELHPDSNIFEGPTPAIGDTLIVTCHDRKFEARVIWGNWSGTEKSHPADTIVPLRVEEI